MAVERQVARGRSATPTVEMLRLVLDGETYESVAARSGVTRTAIERRVKEFAARLCRRVAIEGLSAEATGFVQRLRSHRRAVLAALDEFERDTTRSDKAVPRVVSSEELMQGALRIRGRSSRPLHDQALFLLLFATGARPLEIARLEVRDYLNADGSVRAASEVRAEAANTGKARPLYFTSARLQAAMDLYLAERLSEGRGLGAAGSYRGLDPLSALFLSASGEGFRIKAHGAQGQRRYLCRPILEAYRKLFRYAGLTDVTPLSVRQTLVSRLYARGADESQVGLLLGISDRSGVRELFPKPRPTVPELVRELI